ncbi:TonB-dependent receptor SusC [termite gut metagenome]|uniref:TonB-dependent receptor SusC n=1 Tax=termite gut metagenome TaxID=433724 RepID=A0A5J4SP84_9ZZZZ
MKRKKLYLFLCSVITFLSVTNAQNFEINGIVYDEQGDPAIGVLVVLKETKLATITDTNGRFQLLSPVEKAIVKISGVGYQTLEVAAGKNLQIQLKPEAYLLEDVVVTGYQQLPRDRVTGSFKILPLDALSKPTTNIGSRLIGTIAGLQANTTLDGDISFEIRGKTSLNANAKPLIVVDGFPIEGDLNTLNPNEIESVTLLKDAAAASIWGARSANGVIAVTTKGNRSAFNRSETKIEFSSFFKFAPKIDLNYARSLASSAETIEYEKMAFDAWSANMPADAFNAMSSFSPGLVALNEHRLGYLTEEKTNELLESYKKYDNSEQIKKYLLQSPSTQQYNLNIATDGERANHYLSLLYEENTFYAKGKDNWKTQIGYRTNVQFAKWLKFNLSGTFTYKEATDNSVSNGIFGLTPYEMLVDEEGNRTNLTNGWYQPNLDRYFVKENFPYDFTYNPITELESRDLRTTNIDARLQAGFTVKILKGLTFDSKLQYELNNTLNRNFYSDKSYTVRATVNQSSSYDRGTGKVTLNLPLGGFLDQSRTRTDGWNIRNQINFDRVFNGVHEVTAIAGTEAR